MNPVEEKPKSNKFKSTWSIVFLILVLILGYVFINQWLYGPNADWNKIWAGINSYRSQNKDTINQTDLQSVSGDLGFLKLPAGFSISVFAQNQGGPNSFIPGPNLGIRQMSIKNDTTVLATVLKDGKIIALIDKDGEGKSEEQKVFLDGLNLPHSVEVYGNWVYYTETDGVSRVMDQNNNNEAEKETIQKLVDLPPLGIHFTRTMHIIDDKMYISTGSSCNSCLEQNPVRATIQKCDLDGKNCSIVGSGLRNSVDFTKFEDKIYALDTGKDLLGNDFPPDEINILELGKNYGWPYCDGYQQHDTTFDKDKNPCPETTGSFINLPAHVAAIGINSYTGSQFPDEYKNKLFVALHGSYLSNPPVGYKIVTVDPQTKQVQDFIVGFNDNGNIKGRPVNILNYKNGFLISDDQQGKVYRVSYN